MAPRRFDARPRDTRLNDSLERVFDKDDSDKTQGLSESASVYAHASAPLSAYERAPTPNRI